MMNIISTIIPIFVIIILGWMARVYGFIRAEFIEQANRLVFYLAIPAMVFRSISKTSLHSQFDGMALILTMLAVCAVLGIAWILGSNANVHRRQRGTFIQNSFHGNLGYIGLAVTFLLSWARRFCACQHSCRFYDDFANFDRRIINLSVVSCQSSVVE